jgi:hypothetical protein
VVSSTKGFSSGSSVPSGRSTQSRSGVPGPVDGVVITKLRVPVHGCTKMIPSETVDWTTGSPSRICTSVVESKTTIVPSPTAS